MTSALPVCKAFPSSLDSVCRHWSRAKSWYCKFTALHTSAWPCYHSGGNLIRSELQPHAQSRNPIARWKDGYRPEPLPEHGESSGYLAPCAPSRMNAFSRLHRTCYLQRVPMRMPSIYIARQRCRASNSRDEVEVRHPQRSIHIHLRANTRDYCDLVVSTI